MTVKGLIRNALILLTAIVLIICSSAVVYAGETDYNIRGGAANLFDVDIFSTDEADGSDYIEYVETRDLSGTIQNGVSVGGVDVSMLTYDEAYDKVKSYVNELGMMTIHLSGMNGNVTDVTAQSLGLKWENDYIIADAISLGRSGNIVARYKALKDLSAHAAVLDLELSFDRDVIEQTVAEQARLHDIPAKSASLTRENGAFIISEGQTGYEVDKDLSVNAIVDDLMGWRGEDITIPLYTRVSEPKGNYETLSKVKDLLGSFTTSFSSSGSDRSGNVRNGTRLINGTLLYPGESFSTYAHVSPFTEENGYYLAGSYLNGLVVESLGGGICQVSSTLYNAVLRAELQVDERHNHSMIVNYVKMSSDAAISGTSKDFKFTNSSNYPIYIEGYTTSDKEVVFNIYGVEERPSGRTLEFESVELEKTEPEGDKFVEDSTVPAGEIHVQSPHTGYVGEFWKIVKVDGVEKERVKINKSTYQATQRTATVGTMTDNPAVLAAVRDAINLGNIEDCKAALANISTVAQATGGETNETGGEANAAGGETSEAAADSSGTESSQETVAEPDEDIAEEISQDELSEELARQLLGE